jgi:hypothetical protein
VNLHTVHPNSLIILANLDDGPRSVLDWPPAERATAGRHLSRLTRCGYVRRAGTIAARGRAVTVYERTGKAATALERGATTKWCPACNRNLPRGADEWATSTRSSDGLQGWCRACHRGNRSRYLDPAPQRSPRPVASPLTPNRLTLLSLLMGGPRVTSAIADLGPYGGEPIVRMASTYDALRVLAQHGYTTRRLTRIKRGQATLWTLTATGRAAVEIPKAAAREEARRLFAEARGAA